jgi:hypothetical protein
MKGTKQIINNYDHDHVNIEIFLSFETALTLVA